MDEHEQEQAELLDRYWRTLGHHPETLPPPHLDAETASAAQQLAAHIGGPDPDPDFATTLHRRLETAAAARVADMLRRPSSRDGRSRSVVRPLPRRSITASVVAAALLITAVGIGTLWLAVRPQRASAQAILEKATATADTALGGVQSFHITTASVGDAGFLPGRTLSDPLKRTATGEQWGAAPNRWRSDFTYQDASGMGPCGRDSGACLGSGSDGQAEWSYGTNPQGAFEVRIGALPAGKAVPVNLPITLTMPSGGGAVESAAKCYHPKLAGEATVAGRAAYVIDLGPFLCSPGFSVDRKSGTVTPIPVTPPGEQGVNRMWVDTQTFFFLKEEHDYPDGTLKFRREVTAIAYNIPIPDSVFAYVPPPGATIIDLRPGPYMPAPDPFPVPPGIPAAPTTIPPTPAKP